MRSPLGFEVYNVGFIAFEDLFWCIFVCFWVFALRVRDQVNVV